jgi:hypothetical protein
MLKQFVQQDRSEAHGATNKEHHVCARRRVGEAAVYWAEAYPLGYVEGLNDARTMLADCFSILLCGLGHDHFG